MKRIALAALLAGAIASPSLAQNAGMISTDADGGVAGLRMCPGSYAGAVRCSIVHAYVPVGGSSINTGQISVGTTPTLIAAARVGRQRIVMNVLAANTCNFGNANVTTTTGFQAQPVAGATLPMNTGAAVYGVCSAATTISFLEEF